MVVSSIFDLALIYLEFLMELEKNKAKWRMKEIMEQWNINNSGSWLEISDEPEVVVGGRDRLPPTQGSPNHRVPLARLTMAE